MRLEVPVVRWAYRHRSFTPLLPQPGDYPVDDAVLVERDGVFFRLNRSDCMQWSVFADLPDLSWRSAVETLAPNSLVVDIGANCGAFCLKVAHAVWTRHLEGALVVAFERNPVVFERLSANLALNPERTPVVEVVPVTLGHRERLLGPATNGHRRQAEKALCGVSPPMESSVSTPASPPSISARPASWARSQ